MPTVTPIFGPDGDAYINGIPFSGFAPQQNEEIAPLGAFANVVNVIPAMPQAPVIFGQNKFAGTPFGDASLFNKPKDGWIKYIDFDLLLNDIQEYKGKGMMYNYLSYQTRDVEPEPGPMEIIRSLTKTIEEAIENLDKEIKKETTILPIGKISNASNPFKNRKTNQYFSFEGRLNILPGFLPLDETHIDFVFELDAENNVINYTDLLLYKKDETTQNYITNVAARISTPYYTNYLELCKVEGLKLTDATKATITRRFKDEMAKTTVINNLIWLYVNMPDFVLQSFPDDFFWSQLQFLLSIKRLPGMSGYIDQAILVMLAAIKDVQSVVAKVNANPTLMRNLFSYLDKDYIPDLVNVVTKIGVQVWADEDYNKAKPYLFDTKEMDVSVIEKRTIALSGYCKYIKEENNYQVGVVEQIFENSSPLKDRTIDKVYGSALPFSPVQTEVDKQPVYLPAFALEYFTNLKIAEARSEIINTSMLLILPELASVKAGAESKSLAEYFAEKAGKRTAIIEEKNLLRQVEDLFDNLGGRLYSAEELKLLKIKLKEEFGVELRLIDKEVGNKEMRSLLKDWDERNVVGAFREGPPPEMILRSKNASELTVFHEKIHMEVWYNKLPKMHIVDEEKYVFDAIFKAKDTHGWTDAELIDSYDYVNKKVEIWNKRGKNFSYINTELIEQLKINKQFNVK